MDPISAAAAAATVATVADAHAAPADAPGTACAMALLASGVPLSLLLDLAAPMHSTELMQVERADTTWVPRAVA